MDWIRTVSLDRLSTGLLLPSFRFISVPSRANHWAQVRQRYSAETRTSPKQTVAVVAWGDDEKSLLYLIGKVEEKAVHSIMMELRSEPGFDIYLLESRQNYSAQRREMALMQHYCTLPA